jgi:hypothetical protein
VKQRPKPGADAPLYTTSSKPGNWQLSPEMRLTDGSGRPQKTVIQSVI